MVTVVLQRLRLLLIALLLGGLLLPTMPTAVQASDGGYAYHWLLKFDFETGATGTLFVEVGLNENGAVQHPPLHSHSFPVTCQRVGNMGVSGGVAKFNGGYLQCSLDLQGALLQTFAECAASHAGCTMPIGASESYRSVKVKADLASPPGMVAPILGHPSLRYGVTLFSTQAQINTQFDPLGNVDSPVTLLNEPTTILQPYSARWGCFPDGNCGTYFGIAGQSIYVDSLDQPVTVATPATIFYIGRDLLGNTLSAGSVLDNLIVDPGNGLPG